MDSSNLSSWSERYSLLCEILSRCPEVVRYDRPDEPESATLAHAFSDLEESFRRFSDVHLAKLTGKSLVPNEIYPILHDIGEELRHILYHIKDPHYYRYLFGEEDFPDKP